MISSNNSLSKSLLAVLLLSIVDCAHNSKQDTMVVCDSNGCANRPTNYSSFDPNSAIPSDGNEARIAALEDLARSDPRAAYDLGLRFFRGDSVPQDSYKALQWMRDAAERGNLEAQKAVGRLYLTGLEEMGSDPREAQKWLSIAASRGDGEAAKLLWEAESARRSDEEYYRWQGYWRPIFYNYWYSGYPYYWRWGRGRWYPFSPIIPY